MMHEVELDCREGGEGRGGGRGWEGRGGLWSLHFSSCMRVWDQNLFTWLQTENNQPPLPRKLPQKSLSIITLHFAQANDYIIRRVATCKPGKPGRTSFSETLALFFIQFLSFRKMKVQDRQNVNLGLPERNWLATCLIIIIFRTKYLLSTCILSPRRNKVTHLAF